MAHDQDPSNWTTIGFTIGGLLAGVSAAFGFRRAPSEIHPENSEIQELKDRVRDMMGELEHMKAARAEDAAMLQRLEEKNDQVIIRIFEKLETIGLSVNTLQTQVQMIPKTGHR